MRTPGRAAGAGALALLAVLLAAPGPSHAEAPVAVGDVLAPLELADAHGKVHRVDAGTRGLLLSRDMEGGGFVREALANDGATRLAAAGAVYVADVHGMPALVRRWIAIPRMRQRGYPVLLDTVGAATARLPAQPGRATWLRLDGLRVAEVRFLGSAEEVRAALEGPAHPGAAVPPGD